MALTCPQCAAPMNEVKAPTTTGYLVLLDQCPQCGGIWCDRWELYPITAAAAERIDNIDQTALRQPMVSAADELECPRCRARMRRFRDPTLPAEACIERCPNCEGMWLNRGELQRIKHHGTPPAARTESELDRLATQLRGDPKMWPTVNNLDAAFDAVAPVADAGDMEREVASSAAWLIARLALRLLLHV